MEPATWTLNLYLINGITVKSLILSLFVLSLSYKLLLGQTPEVVSISPWYNEIAESNHPEISVEFNVPIDPLSINIISFSVLGEKSAYHSGEFILSTYDKLVSFISDKEYNAGERVTVRLSNKICSNKGDSLYGFMWTFRIPAKQKETLSFSEPVEYGGSGYEVHCVDMNNDDSPDVITSSGVILINNGNGEFPSSWLLEDADGISSILTDDFNRDGYMDVFYKGSGGLILGLGNGSGYFAKSYYSFWFDEYINVDINLDGYPDIAGINNLYYNDTTSIWSIAINNGFGAFVDTAIVGQVTGLFGRITTTDVDNDGDGDIIIITGGIFTWEGIVGRDGFAVFRNNGSLIFNEFQLYCTGENDFSISFPNYLCTADFNNDNNVDVAIVGNFEGFVTLNLGNGLFGTTDEYIRYFLGGDQPAPPVLGGDINGDDWIDIALSGYLFPPEGPVTYYIVRTNCGSYFSGCGYNNIFQDSLPGNYIKSIDAADVDGDGDLDLVHSGYRIYITFNKDTVTSVIDEIRSPGDFYLYQNYPNPFNPSTTISYGLPYQSSVELVIYDIIGRIVKSFNVSSQSSGYQSIVWDGKNELGNSVASGIYLYRISIKSLENNETFVKTAKLMLMK